ncbi:MAG: hypothetical protein WBD27_00955 [Pyrinomonadaceae bacterium]
MNETSVIESQRVKNIRDDLEKWLSLSKWEPNELRYWIKGYDFFSYGEEPYLWLSRCLPKSSEFLPKMARRIATFLRKEEPFRMDKMTEEDDDRFFYNLFNLSAGLSYRKELGKEFSKIFIFFSENEGESKSFFADDRWYNLNNAFREALINNQTNDNFRNLWHNGLEGNQVSFVVGDMYSNFRGLLHMPETEDSNEPDVAELGWALKQMADYLEPEKKRQAKFRRLLERLKEVWDGYPIWNETLNRLAINFKLQRWATENSEDIFNYPFKSITTVGSAGSAYCVSFPIKQSLDRSGIAHDVILDGGFVYTIRVFDQNKEFLDIIEERVAETRLKSPSVTYSGFVKEISRTFSDLPVKNCEKKAIYESELKIIADSILEFAGMRTLSAH